MVDYFFGNLTYFTGGFMSSIRHFSQRWADMR